MSKKPKRSRHRANLPPWHEPRPPVLDEDYQREVDQAGERLASDHRKALQRAEAAERRAKRAETRAAQASAKRALKVTAESARRAAEAAWLEFQRLDAMVRERPLATPERGRVRRVGVAGAELSALGPDEISDRMRPTTGR